MAQVFLNIHHGFELDTASAAEAGGKVDKPTCESTGLGIPEIEVWGGRCIEAFAKRVRARFLE